MLVSTTTQRRRAPDAIHCECGFSHVFTVAEEIQLVIIKCDCGRLIGWVSDKRELLPITRELQDATIYS